MAHHDKTMIKIDRPFVSYAVVVFGVTLLLLWLIFSGCGTSESLTYPSNMVTIFFNEGIV